MFLLDGPRVQQILINFISNALKFSQQKSTVYLGVSVRGDDDWHAKIIEIRVLDTGIGISKEDEPHIFKPFFKAKNDQSL